MCSVLCLVTSLLVGHAINKSASKAQDRSGLSRVSTWLGRKAFGNILKGLQEILAQTLSRLQASTTSFEAGIASQVVIYHKFGITTLPFTRHVLHSVNELYHT